ncbi:MAG: hypothetical protein ACI3U2_03135, partial [Anaerovibrio sp.]
IISQSVHFVKNFFEIFFVIPALLNCVELSIYSLQLCVSSDNDVYITRKAIACQHFFYKFQFIQRLAVAVFVSLPAPCFRLARKVKLIATAPYNDKYCIIMLYLFRHKEGQVRHVPKENLECSLAS